MIIMFDLLFSQPQNGSKFHGGGEYIKSIFKTFMNSVKSKEEIHVCYDADSFLDDWIKNDIENHDITVHQVKNAAEIAALVNSLAQERAVRFFAGMIYPYAAFSFDENVTAIGTCHGLRMLEKPIDKYSILFSKSLADFKEYFNYYARSAKMEALNRKMYEDAISRFDIVITDSNHSMFSMKTLLNVPDNKKFLVVYAKEKNIDHEMIDYDDTDRFILMVSADRWIKNAYRGIKAIDQLYSSGLIRNIKTKVYGNYPESLKKRLKYPEKFEFYGYVSSEALEQAYFDCEIFFYPSLNEGFGLPPMEAMKYGKTCVISAVCSLPEVYGESVYYCNPYDINEMKIRLLYASKKKIDTKIINDRLSHIRDLQNKHTSLLVDIIRGERNE